MERWRWEARTGRSSEVESLEEDPRDLREDERTSGGLSESCRF